MLNIAEVIKDADAMTSDEWKKICHLLEDHHCLFYKIWEMGKPMFTNSIPTACVTFDKNGTYLYFLFNPTFWQGLDSYNKLFVICHEALHVILNHGVRFKDSNQRETANIAMDVVVNHTLTREFGFDRNLIQNWEELCWVDTVFGKNYNHNGLRLMQGETAEFYFNLLLNKKKKKKDNQQGQQGQNNSGNESGSSSQGQGQQEDQNSQAGSGSSKVKTLDQHHFGDPNSDGTQGTDSQKIIDAVNANLSEEEQNIVKQSISKHSSSESPFSQAGTGAGGQQSQVQDVQVKIKKKWESVIKKWTAMKLMDTEKTVDQWAKEHRRYVLLPQDMMLPTELDIETLSYDKNKIDVYFFLDTSGSCWHLKDRFFAIAKTLPKSRFNVNLFCFDTQVTPTDFAKSTIYGSGGTCFRVIEEYIQQELNMRKAKKKKAKYPDAVWVMTDGYGTKVCPEKPKNWYWFIDHPQYNNKARVDSHMKNLTSDMIPKECNMFSLSDFV